MKFAERVFLIAGIYGVALLGPMYFLEGFFGRLEPPQINHAEFYYGFVGLALAWQAAYLVIARDPARYRPMMPLAALAKLSFAGAMLVLFAAGRVSLLGPLMVVMDFVFAGLFMRAYVTTGRPGLPAGKPSNVLDVSGRAR